MAEQEYDQATLLALGKLAAKVYQNPKTKKAWLKAAKETDPTLVFPELENDSLREELDAKLQAEREEREKERHEARLSKQRESLRDRFSEEQIQDMEKTVMVRYGLADYDAASKIYGADLAPAVPTNQQHRHGANWELPDFKGLKENPTKAARDMAFSVIDELKTPKGRRP